MDHRIVITGIGICAPLSFEELIAGGCGLAVGAGWEIPGASVRLGLVREDVPAAVRALPGNWRPDRLDPVSHFALLAADRARCDSGLTAASDFAGAAVVVASAMGGERTHYAASHQLAEHKVTGQRLRISPFTAPKLMPNASSANVGMLLDAHGPNVSPAAACASGAYALAQAADLIRLGRAEIVVAGAAEAPCEEIAARTFLAGEALSPTGDSLPFHRERNGFVLAEGAAVFVLEELAHARARGARIYAELAGSGLTCDAYHVVAPNPDGIHAAEAMRRALREAGVTPDEVGYINAHATGTPLGDLAECRAIRGVFGSASPMVGATKGATGHLLGAAGAVEAAFSILSMAHRVFAPTLGLSAESVDPACAELGLDLIGTEAREAAPDVVISNSFAFGGHNACLVFRRVDGSTRPAA